MERTESVDKKKVLAYALIAIGMIGFIVLGVVWSKNRANQLAQSDTDTPAQQETPPPIVETPQPTPTDTGHIASTQTTTPSSGPHIVPAAGATDTLLLVGAVSIVAFMGARYLQTRQQMRTAYR